jgi:hypothetical protein
VATEAAWLPGNNWEKEESNKKKETSRKKKERKHERNVLTLTGLLMEGVENAFNLEPVETAVPACKNGLFTMWTEPNL